MKCMNNVSDETVVDKFITYNLVCVEWMHWCAVQAWAIIGLTIGILLVNKGMSGFMSNTLLIPKQDLLVYRLKKAMRGKVKMEYEMK